LAFEDFFDGKRILGVLGKRLARYGLTLHPDKTRFVDFLLACPAIGVCCSSVTLPMKKRRRAMPAPDFQQPAK
jgi:hypothetical protein